MTCKPPCCCENKYVLWSREQRENKLNNQWQTIVSHWQKCPCVTIPPDTSLVVDVHCELLPTWVNIFSLQHHQSFYNPLQPWHGPQEVKASEWGCVSELPTDMLHFSASSFLHLSVFILSINTGLQHAYPWYFCYQITEHSCPAIQMMLGRAPWSMTVLKLKPLALWNMFWAKQANSNKTGQ